MQQGCQNQGGYLPITSANTAHCSVMWQEASQSQDWQPAPAHDSAEGLPLPPFQSALSPWQHAPHAASKPQTLRLQLNADRKSARGLHQGHSPLPPKAVEM